MTKNLTDLQHAALDNIRDHTSALPITGKDLANKIGLKKRETGKDGADMRSIVNALRVKGYPVCASGEGYWWPKDRAELETYIDSFQGRINDQQKACDGMREGLASFATRAVERPQPSTEGFEMWRADGRVIHVMPSRLAEFRARYPEAVKLSP